MHFNNTNTISIIVTLKKNLINLLMKINFIKNNNKYNLYKIEVYES